MGELGEILLVNNTTLQKIFVTSDELAEYVITHTPIGVVVIPASHDVYGTGECAVMSCLAMKNDNNGLGSSVETTMAWYYFDDNEGDAGLTKYDTINCCTNVTSNILSHVDVQSKLPTTNVMLNSSSLLSADGIAKYADSTLSSLYKPSPSPYLTDESRNPIYYSTELGLNALSDFSGLENTSAIVLKLGAFGVAAYNCSRFKTIGTESGDWYLPACGELGYMIVRFNEILQSLKNIRNIYANNYCALISDNSYWSSSESSIYSARLLTSNNGYATSSEKTSNLRVRAFMRI